MAGSWEQTYDCVLFQTKCALYSIAKLSVLYDKTSPNTIAFLRLEKWRQGTNQENYEHLSVTVRLLQLLPCRCFH